jgi:hypothetical protein
VLSVQSGGAVTLASATNNVDTLNITAGGNIQYTDADDLILGTVNAGSGNVTVTAGGTLNGGTITGTTVSLAGTTIGLTTPPTLGASTTTLNLTATEAEGYYSALLAGSDTVPATINAVAPGVVKWNEIIVAGELPVEEIPEYYSDAYQEATQSSNEMFNMTNNVAQSFIISADLQGFFSVAGPVFNFEDEESDIGFSEDGLMIMMKKKKSRK